MIELNIKSRVLDLFQKNPKKEFTCVEVANKLGLRKRQVNSALSDYKKEKRIVVVDVVYNRSLGRSLSIYKLNPDSSSVIGRSATQIARDLKAKKFANYSVVKNIEAERDVFKQVLKELIRGED